jgi:LPXTG-motif cell wall-anchored protein
MKKVISLMTIFIILIMVCVNTYAVSNEKYEVTVTSIRKMTPTSNLGMNLIKSIKINARIVKPNQKQIFIIPNLYTTAGITGVYLTSTIYSGETQPVHLYAGVADSIIKTVKVTAKKQDLSANKELNEKFKNYPDEVNFIFTYKINKIKPTPSKSPTNSPTNSPSPTPSTTTASSTITKSPTSSTAPTDTAPTDTATNDILTAAKGDSNGELPKTGQSKSPVPIVGGIVTILGIVIGVIIKKS